MIRSERLCGVLSTGRLMKFSRINMYRMRFIEAQWASCRTSGLEIDVERV
jgi:hypothetical protein